MTILLVLFALCAAVAADAQPRTKSPAPGRSAAGPLNVAILIPSDKPSIDLALAGLEAAKKHGRVAVTLRLAPPPEEYAAMLDRLAAGGLDLVVGIGALYADAVLAASARYPATRFLLIDAGPAHAPNVRTVTFRTDEGSFLAGVAAAAESRHGAVGFIGPMETPATQALECGYETGIRWAAKELKRTVRGSIVYIGTTHAAFSDPAHGAEASRAMITQNNVDVLYAAAGAASSGVIEAAREAKVKAISYETAPSVLTREVFLTSMRKRFDRAIESAIADVRRHGFHGGGMEMTLANGGVDLALPGQLAPATQRLVHKARTAIVSGREAPCVKYEEPPSAWSFPPRPAAP